ncbi:hypothetical protein [Salmonella sp. s54412]|uniref:hypothetical protein n=2 Tax=unclassified Salmonella TaxID=2614656 RepID=UPI00375492C4
MNGEQGERGLAGFSGSMGESGHKGISGTQGPPGPPGPPGSDATIPVRSEGTSAEKGPRPPEYYHSRFNDIMKQVDTNKLDTDMMFMEIEPIRQITFAMNEVDFIRSPDGSKKHPALTCKDLHRTHPILESGNYWIDPNSGVSDDAVIAFCDFERISTCVHPVMEKVANKSWFSGKDDYMWFSEDISNTERVRYSVDGSQIRFLQMLSTVGWQNATYHCHNSVAWTDERNSTTHSIKLRGDNGMEYHANSTRKFRPKVIKDECHKKDGAWHQTIVEVHTSNTARLPIRDIAVFDVGGKGEEFGLEFGAVCFA